jgi:hypothetical protein
MTFRNVSGTTIIYGKNPTKPNQIANTSDLERKFKGGSVNGAIIERKADGNGVLAYPVIPREVAQAIQNKRKELNLNKQTDLQQKCQIPLDIIKSIEAGTLQLTQLNRTYLHKVARTLGMPALNLPKS